jgi:hypothetical protein
MSIQANCEVKEDSHQITGTNQFETREEPVKHPEPVLKPEGLKKSIDIQCKLSPVANRTISKTTFEYGEERRETTFEDVEVPDPQVPRRNMLILNLDSKENSKKMLFQTA